MTTESTEEQAKDKAIWGQRCAVLSRAWVQVRYHRRRQRFFDLLDKITKSITVALGASLFGGQVAKVAPGAAPWLAAGITVAGLLALIFGYGDRKQLHKELGEQAANLAAAIEAVPADGLSYAITAAWHADFARLMAKSPPALKTLTLICEHEQATAEGHPGHVLTPCWLQRLVAHIL